MDKSLPCIHPIYISGQVKYIMINLITIFENLINNGRFSIPSNDFSGFFDNSITNVVKFFHTNLFVVELSSDNSTTDTYVRERFIKEISPTDIYSIINGAKPLIIEYRIESPHRKGEDFQCEVWLNK